MSTFEDWLDNFGLDGHVQQTMRIVKSKRKEMVCANCKWSDRHIHNANKVEWYCRNLTRHTLPNDTTVWVKPDFYCKSFIMKGEE